MIVATVGIASPEPGGDWWYRTAQPMASLAQCDDIWGVEVNHLHRARKLVCERADLLVANMVWDDDMQEAVSQRRARGQMTVLEFNDDLGEMPWSTKNDRLRYVALLMAMPMVDGVQFTSTTLARRYGRWCRRSVVIPNQVSRALLVPRRVPDGEFVVGWGGSLRHRDDLAAVMPALLGWLDEHPAAQLRVMADPAVFRLSPHPHIQLAHPGDIATYYKWVSALDVGIAPLNLTQWNRCRSDVKWLEYAVNGVVPVVQDLDPYQHADPALRFTSPQELVDHLSWLHDHPDERQRLSERAVSMTRHRDSTLGALQRLAFYRDLTPPDTHGESLLSALRTYDGAGGAGRYVNCWFGEHERAEWARLDKLSRPLWNN